jgi:hypothetical protein
VGTGAFADKHVGTAKPVTVSGFTLSGADSGNYNVVQPTGLTANVSPAALTVSTNAVNKVYDSNTTAPGAAAVVTTGSLFGTDALTGGTFAFVSKNVGNNVTVNVSGVSVNDGNGGNNYTVTNAPNNTSSITRATLGVTGVSATGRTYDGTTVAALGGAATVTALGTDSVSVAGVGTGAFADKPCGHQQARHRQWLHPERC